MLRKTSLLSRAGLALALAAGMTAGLKADPPSWAKDLTPPTLGKQPRMEPVRLQYGLSWKGMLDAGNLAFVFGEKPADGSKSYLARVTGGSTGLAKSLFPYRITMTSQMEPDTLRPQTFTVIENDDGENVTTRTRYSATEVTSDIQTYVSKKKKTKNKSRTFAFMPTLDALSAMLHVRSQPLKDGDTVKYAFFPTSKPYLITVKVQGREQFQNRSAIRLAVSLQKIGDDLELKSYDKLTSATLWLSDDAQRIPLELRAAVFIGDVRMTLKSTSAVE